MKLSDYVVDFLANCGIKHSFVVTGGAVIHLLDSVNKHPAMQHVCVQHEQLGGAAADGYYRASGRIGLAMTTSGPGATNLTTSLCNAYFDSIPMIYVTGQVSGFVCGRIKSCVKRDFRKPTSSQFFKAFANM